MRFETETHRAVLLPDDTAQLVATVVVEGEVTREDGTKVTMRLSIDRAEFSAENVENFAAVVEVLNGCQLNRGTLRTAVLFEPTFRPAAPVTGEAGRVPAAPAVPGHRHPGAGPAAHRAAAPREQKHARKRQTASVLARSSEGQLSLAFHPPDLL